MASNDAPCPKGSISQQESSLAVSVVGATGQAIGRGRDEPAGPDAIPMVAQSSNQPMETVASFSPPDVVGSNDQVALEPASAIHMDQLSLHDRSMRRPLVCGGELQDPSTELTGRNLRRSESTGSANSSCCSTASLSNPRTRFLLFVKILFKCLAQANEPEVLIRAKKIVVDCTRKNRKGDPQFTPLMDAVEKRLRGFVGEVQWRRSTLLLRHCILKRKRPALVACKV